MPDVVQLFPDRSVCPGCSSPGRRHAIRRLDDQDSPCYTYRCGMTWLDEQDAPVGYATQRIACEEISRLRGENKALRDLCEITELVADRLADRLAQYGATHCDQQL